MTSGPLGLASVVVGALLLGPALSACGTRQPGPGERPAPTDAGPSAPAGRFPSATATGVEPTTGRAPPSSRVAPDQRFSFADIAEYPDGLEIEVTDPVAGLAEARHRGAEGTGGAMVISFIRIANGTASGYDARAVRVLAEYGDGVLARPITDSSGELKDRFATILPVGQEALVPMGFAIPAAALRRVTYVVDPADGEHEAVSFTGPVPP